MKNLDEFHRERISRDIAALVWLFHPWFAGAHGERPKVHTVERPGLPGEVAERIL